MIGGGVPVGAYGGSRAVMAHVAPLGAVYQAGTLSGNPLAVAAGLATLARLADRAVYATLEARGAELERGLTPAAASAAAPLTAHPLLAILPPFFSAPPVTPYPSPPP